MTAPIMQCLDKVQFHSKNGQSRTIQLTCPNKAAAVTSDKIIIHKFYISIYNRIINN